MFSNLKIIQSGSSMLEVLVSLVILAIGILSVSGLQTSSLQSNHVAYLRTQAAIYAVDIVERMQANLPGVRSGSYNKSTAVISAGCSSRAGGGCASQGLARNDLAQWMAVIADNLPAGVAEICLDSTPLDGVPSTPACDEQGDFYALKIWWDQNRDGNAEQRLVMSFWP